MVLQFGKTVDFVSLQHNSCILCSVYQLVQSAVTVNLSAVEEIIFDMSDYKWYG